MSVGALPSLVIGAAAFGAGELLLHDKTKKTLRDINRNLYDVLVEAKSQNKQVAGMINKVNDKEMKNNIKEISESIDKIIETVEKNPNKHKNVNNFFNYYLPVTLSILNKYDEIENQGLTTEESAKFMKQAQNMTKKINAAFKTQLANLYQKDIVDTDAEMKVFDSMLKADGYDSSSDFKK